MGLAIEKQGVTKQAAAAYIRLKHGTNRHPLRRRGVDVEASRLG